MKTISYTVRWNGGQVPSLTEEEAADLTRRVAASGLTFSLWEVDRFTGTSTRVQ